MYHFRRVHEGAKITMTSGHWTQKHPGAGAQLAIAMDMRGIPFLTIVRTERKRGKCIASIPWEYIVCLWSVQIKEEG